MCSNRYLALTKKCERLVRKLDHLYHVYPESLGAKKKVAYNAKMVEKMVWSLPCIAVLARRAFLPHLRDLNCYSSHSTSNKS